MKHKGWIIAAVLVGVFALLLSLLDQGTDAAVAQRAASPAAVPAERVAPELIAAAERAPVELDSVRDGDAADVAEPLPAPGETLWVARVLRPDGQPASGVPWVLESEWTPEGAYANGTSALPPIQRGLTDARGRAVAHLAPLQGCQRELRVEPEGLLGATWDGEEHQPGLVRELQTVTLGAGGTLVGRVRLASGGALPGDTTVSASLSWPDDWNPLPFRAGRPGRRAAVASDGRFTLEHVVPGHVRVEADVPGSDGARGVELDVAEGATAELELLAADVDPARLRHIVLEPRGESGWPCEGLAPGCVSLRAPDGPRQALSNPGNGWLFFEDLEPGDYVIDVDDPAWRPQQLVAHTGPDPTDLTLVGDSTLELSVVDAVSGEPVGKFGVRGQPLRDDEWHETPSGPAFDRESSDWATPVPMGEHAGGKAVLERLSAHLHRLRVDAPGYLMAEAAWRGVPRGERGALTIALHPAGEIAGTVVDEAGAPQPGVRVGLFEAPPEGQAYFFLDHDEYWSFEPSQGLTCELLADAVTDADGRFALTGAPANRAVARAWRSSACDATSGVIEPGHPPREPLRLVLPSGSAVLAGRVVLPPAVPAEQLTLHAVCIATAAAPSGVPRRRAPLVSRLDAQGGFRFADAMAGTWELWLSCSSARYLDVGGVQAAWVGDYARRLATVQVPQREELMITPAPADTPGLLAVRVQADGVQAAGLGITAQIPGEQQAAARATVPADGVAQLGPLWPRAVKLAVQDPSGAWGWNEPEPVQVPPGAIGAATISVSIVTGTLRVLEAGTQAPRAGTVVAIWHHAAMGWAWDVGRTGTDGRITLSAPAGELRVLVAPGGELLVPRDGESLSDFIGRRAAAGLIPVLQPGDLPAAPPPRAASVPWRSGADVLDVRL